MPSAWIRKRSTKDGHTRYRVEYRVGGRESRPRYAGSFCTQREALARKAWVAGERANTRVPDLELLGREPERAPTVREACSR